MEAATTTPTRKRQRPGWASAANVERFALLGAWAAVILAFSLAKPDIYPTSGNFQTIFGSQAVLLVLALGLLIPLTTGDFDLSVASALSLSSMVIAVLNVNHGWGIVPAVLAGIACGVLMGFINGGLVVMIGIDSFIVTLGTGTVALGLVQWMSDSTTVTGVASGLTDWTIGHHLFGISLMFYYGVAATLLLWWLLERTPLGRRLLFVGRGPNVARLSGLRVERIRWGAFVASGTVAGIAGAMYAGTLAGADPSSGQSFLLPAFAAAYLGATAIVPGRFNPLGTFVAVYFLVSGVTGLQLLGVANFVQQLFYGGALVIAVALSQLVRRRPGSRASAAGGAGA
jgi:ribose transport system permease protein